MLALIAALLVASGPRCFEAAWPSADDDGIQNHGICCWWPDGSAACTVDEHEDDDPPLRQESPPDPTSESGTVDA